MNDMYNGLKDSLSNFKEDKLNYDTLQDENQVEMLNTSRIVKREVIDMSDMVDKICGILLKQDAKIKNQNNMIREQNKYIKRIN